MMTALQNRNSLTFYQTTSAAGNSHVSSAYTGGIASFAIANTSAFTTTTTSKFNTQLNDYLSRLNSARANDAATLDLSSANSTARNRGVSRAWEYEKADAEMGGKGSANWNKQEQRQIIDKGKVKGAEGHHQQNVADHPEEQANPDNIKFYKSKKEHLEKGHDGDFHKESNEPMTDKNKMLQNTNSKRVFRNELRGVGIAVGIGLGIGFTIGFAVTLAQSGVSPDSIKVAFVQGSKGGI